MKGLVTAYNAVKESKFISNGARSILEAMYQETHYGFKIPERRLVIVPKGI